MSKNAEKPLKNNPRASDGHFKGCISAREIRGK